MSDVKRGILLLKTRGSRRKPRKLQGPVTAIEVDGSTLRLVTAGSRTSIARAVAGMLDLPSETERTDAEVVGRALAGALERLKIKPGDVVIGVPRASVVLRTLTLPALQNTAELASMVHLQIGKDLPFRVDEAVIDFKVLRPAAPLPARPAGEAAPGTEKTTAPAAVSKVEVLVAVVKREVTEFYRQVAVVAGLKLAALGLQPYGNVRCAEACRATGGESVAAVITLRPDEVGIDIVEEQSLLFSRGAAINLKTEAPAVETLPLAAAAPAETPSPAAAEGAPAAEPGPVPPPLPPPLTFVETVTIEVVRSLHSYAGMGPRNQVMKLVVAGATGQEEAVVKALQGRLSIPCEVLDVARAMSLSSSACDPAGCSPAAVGLALGALDAEGLPFDFLHPKRPATPRDARKTMILLGSAAMAAVLIFLLGLNRYLVNQRQKLRQNVAAELAETKKKRPVYRQMRQQLLTIEDWAKGGRNWLEHYAFLSGVLPSSEEIYVTSVSISGSGTIRLTVLARSGAVLAKLDKQLRDAGYDVKPLAINPGEEKHGYDFRSTVELDVPAKMKIDLSKVRPPPRPADDSSLDGVKKGGGQ